MTGPRVRAVGRFGWLVELSSDGEVAALHRYLVARRERGDLPGILDLVPGARTVLLDGTPAGPGRGGGLGRAALNALLRDWDPAAPMTGPPPRHVQIGVRYDGVDLAHVARLTGYGEDAIAAAHTGTDLTVAFCGFSPGFAYLAGLPAMLRVPRREEPRVAVPAGAVALAEGYTGIYPRRSPGGWQIIGHTRVELWNTDREPPALLSPGTVVRFTRLPR
jgi:KipI family sensor histidine kinase inhibitor